MRTLVAAAALAPLAAACAGGPAENAWSGTVVDSAGIPVVMNPSQGMWDGNAWTVREELSIGELEGDLAYQFGQIVGMDVDDAGNIYVADMQAAEIRVFDPQGTYLRTLGTPGSGPGELGQAIQGVFVAGDQVLIPDLGNFRIARMSLEGEWLGSVRIDATQGVPVRWDEGAAGSVVAQLRYVNLSDTVAAPKGDPIVVLDSEGIAVDTLAHLPPGLSLQLGPQGAQRRIFDAEPMWDVAEDGRLVTGMNNAFRIEVRAPDGSLQHVVTMPYEPRPVTERDQRVVMDVLSEAAAQQGLPPAVVETVLGQIEFAEHYPAFVIPLSGPQGTLWVQRILTGDDLAGEDEAATFDPQDLGSNEWDVFDPEGHYLGMVAFPQRFQPVRTVGGKFYGVGRDDLDVQSVKVFQVVTGAAGS